MHVTADQLASFSASGIAVPHGAALLRHLRAGCERCRLAIRPFLEPWLDDPGGEPDMHSRHPRHPQDGEHGEDDGDRHARRVRGLFAGSGAEDRLLRAAVRAVRSRVNARSGREDERIIQVVRRIEDEDLAVLGRLPRHLRGRPAILALLRRSWSLRASYPREMLRLAEMAADLAATHPLQQRNDRAWHDLRCRIGIDLANAYRVNEAHSAAREALRQAALALRAGSGDPLLRARLIDIQAHLLGNQGRYDEARAALRTVLRIYREQAQALPLARALISDGNYAHSSGSLDLAADRFTAALRLLDRRRSPYVTLAAQHSLCDTMLAGGRTREALHAMRQMRLAFGATAQGALLARFTWLEGRVLDRAGDRQGADGAYATSRCELEALRLHYLAGQVTLEHAAARERRGEEPAARSLVFDATDLLLRAEPHREVYAAAMLLRAASRFSSAQVALPLSQVVDFLNRAQFNPTVRLQSFLS